MCLLVITGINFHVIPSINDSNYYFISPKAHGFGIVQVGATWLINLYTT